MNNIISLKDKEEISTNQFVSMHQKIERRVCFQMNTTETNFKKKKFRTQTLV